MAQAVDISALFGGGEQGPSHVVQIGYGKATFPTSSITIAGFVVEAEFIRTLASKKLGKESRTLTIPVSAFPDIDGWLFSDQIRAVDGTIFLIQTSVKHRGVRVRDGSIFIRARQDAAALLITANIPHDARCTLRSHNHTVFSGHGDILTVEDLAEESIVPGKGYISAYMDPEELTECYDIVQLQAAKSHAPKVETHTAEDGTEVKLKIDRPNRRMRIRR